jgi:hypothetical protein
LIEGGKLYKLRMPLPDATHDPMMPEDLAAVAEEMQSRYMRVTPGEFEPGSGWAMGEVGAGARSPDERDWLRHVVVEGKGGGH